ncbi:signal transduction histidine kinase [Catenulispora sp. MAP5-51]|uniref:sensor histidine kinase n=1 Tax=Catenulispora sp. MAP5-51 TaxID=3156298 RepID=UPI0035187D5F
MSENRPFLPRVPPPLVVACVWVLTTSYLLLAQSQRMQRPWGPVVGVGPGHRSSWAMDDREWVVLALAGVVVACGCRWLARRPLGAIAALVVGALALNYDIHSAGIAPDQYLPVCAALYFVAAGESQRTGACAAAVAGAGVLGYVVVCLVRGLRVDTAVEAVVVLCVALAAVVGDSRRRERAHVRETRARVASQAVVAERLRIARELHDMVAHTIGVVALQAGAAKLVVRRRPDDAVKALGVVEDAARETLAGLRRMLGALHDDGPGADAPPEGLDCVEQLVDRAREAGVHIEVERRGVCRLLPPEVDLAAFRIVQESVTNVLKHSGARGCRVRFEYGEADLAIEVVDDGRHAGCGTDYGTGYGLAGMRERVELLRGEFSAGPRAGGGFLVAARIPVPVSVPVPVSGRS